MNLLLRTVMQEHQRIENVLTRYETELLTLPKGSISEKRSGGKVLLLFEVPRWKENCIKIHQSAES